MKHTAVRGLRIALSLAALAVAVSQQDGLNLVVQQMREIGTRQWLGLMAGSIIGGAPAIAPLAQRIARSLPGRTDPVADSRDAGTADAA